MDIGIDKLMESKKQEVLNAIEKINFSHRYDVDAMFGALTAEEAEEYYRDLLSKLKTMPGLIPEDIDELAAEIEIRIQNIPQVEKEKEADNKKMKEREEKAFQDAKERFKNLSFFKQIRLRLEKRDPNSLNLLYMDVNEVERLYKEDR